MIISVQSIFLDDEMLYEILIHSFHVESQDTRKSTCQRVFCVKLSVTDNKPALSYMKTACLEETVVMMDGQSSFEV